jgi:hypothetical protein
VATATRLRGTASFVPEGRRPLRRVTLISGGKTIATIDEGELVIDLRDGGSTVVEAPGDALVLVGGRSSVHKGAWSMLRDRLEAAAIARNVLPPDAPSELSVLTLEPGQHVEVYGEVLDEAFDEGEAAMRDAPRKHPSRVLASILSAGDDPATAMRAMTFAIADHGEAKPTTPEAVAAPTDPAEPGYRQPWLTWVPLGIGVLAVSWLLIGSVTSEDALFAWRERVTAVSFAALAWSFRPTPRLPEFRLRKTTIKDRGAVPFFVRLASPLVALELFSDLSHMPRNRYAPLTLLVISACFLAGWMLNEFFWKRPRHLIIARLAGAPPVPLPDADGREGSCEGTVACKTPVRVADREAAFGLTEEWTRERRNRAPERESAKLHGRGAFTIETGAVDVSVEPDECLWATTVKETEKGTFRNFESEWVPVGGGIAAAGHFAKATGLSGQDELRVISDGTRPALFLATSAKGDPLALARRIVWSRRVTLAGLSVLAAILGVLAVTGPLGR